MIVDTHAADGIKVGMQHRGEGVAMICPEKLPQRFDVVDTDAAQVEAFVAAHT